MALTTPNFTASDVFCGSIATWGNYMRIKHSIMRLMKLILIIIFTSAPWFPIGTADILIMAAFC